MSARAIAGILCAGLIAVVAISPAFALETASPPQRTINLLVYGADPCPKAQGDEIVVCGRRPESERYRIPKSLRNQDDGSRPSEVAWGSRVAEMEEVSRPSMPGSCSVVGSGGQSGCFQQIMRQWSSERRARPRR